MPSCHTRSFTFRHISTMCAFEITSRKRIWTLLTFVNTLKRLVSAEQDGSFSKERSSFYCSLSASTFTKGELWTEFSFELHVCCSGSLTLVVDGLYCFLNLLDLSEDLFDWSKSFSVCFKIFARCQQSLAETLTLWYAQGFIWEGEGCQVPLMSGQDDIACRMGFIVPFICVHQCHNNYIKFWKRVCNWFSNAI